MKKNTRFKKAKAQAIRMLSRLPIESFNRFTKEELIEIFQPSQIRNSTEEEWSPSLYEGDQRKIVSWCLNNFKPLKLNFHDHIVDIKIVFNPGVKKHWVVTSVKPIAKKMKRINAYYSAGDEFSKIDSLNTELNLLFNDISVVDSF